MTCAAGTWSLTCGLPDREPLQCGGRTTETVAGAYAAAATLIAVEGRARHGRGDLVDVSAWEAAITCAMGPTAVYQQTGQVAERHSDHMTGPSFNIALPRRVPRRERAHRGAVEHGLPVRRPARHGRRSPVRRLLRPPRPRRGDPRARSRRPSRSDRRRRCSRRPRRGGCRSASCVSPAPGARPAVARRAGVPRRAAPPDGRRATVAPRVPFIMYGDAVDDDACADCPASTTPRCAPKRRGRSGPPRRHGRRRGPGRAARRDAHPRPDDVHVRSVGDADRRRPRRRRRQDRGRPAPRRVARRGPGRAAPVGELGHLQLDQPRASGGSR